MRKAPNEASEDRRTAILKAALACFTERGFQKTTMENVRRRAGASTGSLYHHFRSKERLAGSLCIEGIRTTKEQVLTELIKHRSAERGIRAVVRWYLRWVCQNPAMASYLLNHPHAEFMIDAQPDLHQLNVELRNEVREWIDERVRAGELPAMDMEMYWAAVLGPSEFLCRRRLQQGRPADILASARELEDVTWGGIQSRLQAG